MKKQKHVVSIILISAIALTGCGKTKQLAELEQKYETVCTNYSEVVAGYNDLKASYDELSRKYERITNLPDMVVSLVDGAEVVQLTLSSSLEESQKNCKPYTYHSGSYNITMTCNSGEKISSVYWCYNDGMLPIMDMVDSVDDKSYTLKLATNKEYMNSLIIECEGKNAVYVSFYGEDC